MKRNILFLISIISLTYFSISHASLIDSIQMPASGGESFHNGAMAMQNLIDRATARRQAEEEMIMQQRIIAQEERMQAYQEDMLRLQLEKMRNEQHKHSHKRKVAK